MPNVRGALLREIVIAALLLWAVAAVTVGAALLLPAAGWIVGGVGLAGWTVVVLGDVT